MAADTKDRRDSLDGPPSPPELRVRKGLGGVVASRDAAQGGVGPDSGPQGSIPGLGGPNAIGDAAMKVEQALGAFAQTIPDPAPVMDLVARFRAIAMTALSSSAAPGQPQPLGGQLTGIVAPPAPISPPAMNGPGMPAPPMQ